MSIQEQTISYLLKRIYKLESELESAKSDKMESDYNSNAANRCAADYLKRLHALRDLVSKGFDSHGNITICNHSPLHNQICDLLELIAKEDN